MSLDARIDAIHRRLGPRALGRFIVAVDRSWEGIAAAIIERTPAGWSCFLPWTTPGDPLAALSPEQRAEVNPTPNDTIIRVDYVQNWRPRHEP